MIRNCLQPIILLQSVSPGPPKLRNPKYVVTFCNLLCAAHTQVEDPQDWAVVSISWWGNWIWSWKVGLEAYLFGASLPVYPFLLSCQGLLEHACISVSPVGYFPAHFSLSRRGRASVHHCKVISYFLTVEKKDDQLTVKLLGADELLALLLW